MRSRFLPFNPKWQKRRVEEKRGASHHQGACVHAGPRAHHTFQKILRLSFVSYPDDFCPSTSIHTPFIPPERTAEGHGEHCSLGDAYLNVYGRKESPVPGLWKFRSCPSKRFVPLWGFPTDREEKRRRGGGDNNKTRAVTWARTGSNQIRVHSRTFE